MIELGRNTGFAVACNRGVRAAAGADLVALVNSDVVLAADWLAAAWSARSRRPGDASVACKMVDLADPGVIYDAGDVLRRDGACRAARPLPARRRPLGRARRGVLRLRGRGALPPRRVPGRGRVRRALLRVPGGRRPGTAAAHAGLDLPLRAARASPATPAAVRPACWPRRSRAGWSATRCCSWRKRVPAALAAARGLPPARLGVARGARRPRRAGRVPARRRRRAAAAAALLRARAPRCCAAPPSCPSRRSCPTSRSAARGALGYEASRNSTE